MVMLCMSCGFLSVNGGQWEPPDSSLSPPRSILSSFLAVMFRARVPAVTFIVALLLAVFLIVPSVEAAICGDDMGEHSMQGGKVLSGEGEPKFSTHGHCHHGSSCVLPVLMSPNLVDASSASLARAPVVGVLCQHPEGLIRPPRA